MSCDKERILKGKTEHGGRPGTGGAGYVVEVLERF